MPGRSGGRISRSLPAILVLTAAGLAGGFHPDGAPPGHTGGFGEPTCAACHLAGSTPRAADIELRGVPAAWDPGATYRLTVVVRGPGLERAGFQLAARFADGPCAGRQAGTLAAIDGRAATRPDSVTGILYVDHTALGTAPARPGVGEWTLDWTAPADPGGTVVLHAAGNAANDDASELGDAIAVTAVEVTGP